MGGVRKCSYPECTNKQDSSCTVTLHHAPSQNEPEKRALWLATCALSPNDPGQRIFVCSEHFVGGAGPTKTNPNPLITDPVTPRSGDAVDALLSLCCDVQEDRRDAVLCDAVGVEHRTEFDNNAAAVRGCTVVSEADLKALLCVQSFVEYFPDETPNKFKTLVALRRIESLVKSLTQVAVRTSTKSKSARRSLMTDLQSPGTPPSDDNEEPLPPLPVTPSHTTATLETEKISATRTCLGVRSVRVQCVRAPLAFYQCWQISAEQFHHFTGLTHANFEVVYEFLGGDAVCKRLKYKYEAGTPVKDINSLLSPKDRMFITLLRLRRGIPLKDLAYLFGISLGGVSAIVYTWMRFMSLQFQRLHKQMFVSAEHQKEYNNALFDQFPNLRVIIDATEFGIQHPFRFQLQSNTYPNYKSTNTLKYLIGIARSGAISFISKGFEGSVSDKQIVIQSGLLNRLEENDAVMADRGFDIEVELNEIGADLYIPSFLGRREHLTGREELKSKAVSAVRIFVEVAIGRIKQNRLLRGVIPNKLLPILDDMVYVAGFISNLSEEYVPVLQEEQEDG